MRARHRQNGTVLILVLVGLVAMIGMVGLALDGGHTMLSKTRLQNTVDAAALSAAKELDLTDDTAKATAAALLAFSVNGDRGGHRELGEAYRDGTIEVVVEFSETLNPFIPGGLDPEYVRVRARNFRLANWFASLVSNADKAVAASAVAGPSPTIDEACNIAPMMVCGDPAAGAPYWGYTPGVPDVLKASPDTNETPGPGNFQLIRLGDSQGGADLREAMAGNYDGCASAGDTVDTEPGNKVDPVAGLNTRFGEHVGALRGTESIYPPDVVTTETSLTSSDTDGDGVDEIYEGSTPITDNGLLSFNYDDYLSRLQNGPLDEPDLGRYQRRLVSIPFGDCSTPLNGAATAQILGFGCYFLLQQAGHTGNSSEVYGQFIENCNAGGVPGPAPGDAPGLYIIQLYKDPGSNDS